MDCFDLTLVSERGVDFDSEKHEACGARCAPDHRDGSVLEIVRPGFLLRGKVLRCATVVVNRHDYDNVNDDYSDPGSPDIPANENIGSKKKAYFRNFGFLRDVYKSLTNVFVRRRKIDDGSSDSGGPENVP